MKQVWWTMISKAALFIQQITDSLLKHQSLILLLPPEMPWRSEMMERLDEKLMEQNNEKRLEVTECPEQEPGAYLLEHYCKQEKRAQYRYGKSFAAFLAQENTVLSTRYIWLKNVSGEQLAQWCQFIRDYYGHTASPAESAVFILELKEQTKIPKGISRLKNLSFSDFIEPFDVYTFCALSCAEMQLNTQQRRYLSEMVSTICGNDVELCAECIAKGSGFLESPAACLTEIAGSACRSDGSPFEIALSEEKIREKIWESQVKILFPIIEQYRSGFVKKHEAEIQAALPLQNALGEEITSVCDVELGLLIQLTARGMIRLDDQNYRRLDLFRLARNTLAHLKPVSYADAKSIMQTVR